VLELRGRAGEADADVAGTQVTSTSRKSLCARPRDVMTTLVTGWMTYARQSVVFAGLSLSLLYMTVLGFDSITVGEFVIAQYEH